jgi:phosphatidylserine decarboxylase
VSFAAIRDRVALDAVRRAPKGLLSEVVGWSARRRVPRALRAPLYGAFARVVGADLDECERPLEDYASFGAFFARRLADGRRVWPIDPVAIAAPCDGRVAALGTIEAGQMLQVKGRPYALADLLGDAARAEAYEGGAYLTVYLSPRDFHRVHSPVAGRLTGYDYLPGDRFPVMPFFAERVDGLLSGNERVALHLEGGGGPLEVVMVAAVGVGNLALSRPAIESRAFRGQVGPRRERFAALPVDAGGELGAFELGSTVVLVFAPGRATLDDLAIGATLRVGEPIGALGRGGR